MPLPAGEALGARQSMIRVSSGSLGPVIQRRATLYIVYLQSKDVNAVAENGNEGYTDTALLQDQLWPLKRTQ